MTGRSTLCFSAGLVGRSMKALLRSLARTSSRAAVLHLPLDSPLVNLVELVDDSLDCHASLLLSRGMVLQTEVSSGDLHPHRL